MIISHESLRSHDWRDLRLLQLTEPDKIILNTRPSRLESPVDFGKDARTARCISMCSCCNGLCAARYKRSRMQRQPRCSLTSRHLYFTRGCERVRCIIKGAGCKTRCPVHSSVPCRPHIRQSILPKVSPRSGGGPGGSYTLIRYSMTRLVMASEPCEAGPFLAFRETEHAPTPPGRVYPLQCSSKSADPIPICDAQCDSRRSRENLHATPPNVTRS